MTTTTTTTVYTAIPAAVLEQLRIVDDAGRPAVPFTDDEGGAPLRCCLRRSVPGERLALVSYAPLRRWAADAGVDPGPYDEQGPVFIHARTCAGQSRGTDAYPIGLHGRRRVFRAYSAEGRILGGAFVEAVGERAEPLARRTVDDLLTDPEVAFVHVRAVEFGCFLFEARRTP
jgi:hypothetical protein